MEKIALSPCFPTMHAHVFGAALRTLQHQVQWYIASNVTVLQERQEHARMCRAAQVAPIPADIQDRRVEITGPVDRKMVINALNSGASVYMADFEDSNAPTWCANSARMCPACLLRHPLWCACGRELVLCAPPCIDICHGRRCTCIFL
jgi:hypothetical protein